MKIKLSKNVNYNGTSHKVDEVINIELIYLESMQRAGVIKEIIQEPKVEEIPEEQPKEDVVEVVEEQPEVKEPPKRKRRSKRKVGDE